jgi:hypothetical protein
MSLPSPRIYTFSYSSTIFVTSLFLRKPAVPSFGQAFDYCDSWGLNQPPLNIYSSVTIRKSLFRNIDSFHLLTYSVALVRKRTIPTERLRLSAKLMPTSADRGCHVASVTDPYGRILGFLDRDSFHFGLKTH